jgi:hypothetical protein
MENLSKGDESTAPALEAQHCNHHLAYIREIMTTPAAR